MNIRLLKPLRVIISLLFLGLTAFLFLDFRDVGAQHIATEILFLQFVPSVLKFINAAGIGAAGFILVLVLTLLFGRVYCSTICPLGTLQDIIHRLIRRNKRPEFICSKPHHLIRYTILILTVLLFLTGSGLLLNLLDPFSVSGRMFSNLLRPLAVSINNLGAYWVEQAGIHFLYRIQLPVIAPVSIIISMAMLMLVTVLCARHGRLYCNTICPVGALLGLVSKAALFRLAVNKDSCTECGLCERVCKAGCIDIQKKEIDLSRCVFCCNCLNACPGEVLRFEKPWRQRTRAGQPENGFGRRRFMVGLAAGGVAVAFNAFGKTPGVTQSRPTTVPVNPTHPVAPPGSASIDRFTAICTACHLCVSVCPSRVLVPSFGEYGMSGMMQPQMGFKTGHCNYDCTACLEVCPSGAIGFLSREQKQRTQIGIAKFIRENCVVYTDNTNCGACSEHCPTKAVRMVPYLKMAGRQLVIPEVTPDICVGCGGCEHACPTRPYKAIYVDGNPVHKIARKPVERKIEQKTDDDADFPF